MTKIVKYEVECNRTNISPRQFYTYCCKRFKEKTGFDLDSTWIDGFDEWVKPYAPCDVDRKYEKCKAQPYNYNFYLKDGYTFILEWDDGHGYMYAMEFER